MTPFEAAKHGTAEIALAVLATTLSLVVVFIPVSFMSSISGRFLYQFGITAAAAVLVSLLVSFTLTPMMCARLLKASPQGHPAGDSKRGFYRHIDGSYTWMLKTAMRFRWAVAIVAIATIASTIPIYNLVKQEFLPSDVDEAEFNVRIAGPEGMSMAAMDEVVQKMENDVAKVPGVTLVQGSVGGSFLGSANSGELYVRIEPHEGRYFSLSRFFSNLFKGEPGKTWEGNYKQSDVMQQVRAKLRAYPDFRASVRNFESFRLGGGNFDIEFVIRGPELEKLSEYAEALRVKTRSIPGIVDADTTLKMDKPELRVKPDYDRAADMGIDARAMGTSLRLMVGGDQEVTRFRDPTLAEDYDVRLRLVESARNDPSLLDSLYLPRTNGEPVQLSAVAEIEHGVTPARIDRVDRQRSVQLRAGIAPGYAQADRLEAVRNAAVELNMLPGYTTSVTGKGRELERTFEEFLWAFLLSVIFMYMILAANYESFIHPLTILLSLPLSIPFALLSLYVTGSTLNLYSALGILVLFGVVKKNSILQIDHMNHLRDQGMNRYDAIIQGNRDRLRPILMTTLTLVAGMLPLLIGTGPGAEERYTTAVVIIGGQSLSLLLTLLVTPVVYSYLDDVQTWLGWQSPPKNDPALAAAPASTPA